MVQWSKQEGTKKSSYLLPISFNFELYTVTSNSFSVTSSGGNYYTYSICTGCTLESYTLQKHDSNLVNIGLIFIGI